MNTNKWIEEIIAIFSDAMGGEPVEYDSRLEGWLQDLISKVREERDKEIIRSLTGTDGIEGNFCDWNKPSVWDKYPTPTPREVEKWVINKIKSTNKTNKEE